MRDVCLKKEFAISKFQTHHWIKHPDNPILPPSGKGDDQGCCMNPFVVKQGDEYWLFYSGEGEDGHRRVCLAIAKINDLTKWKRMGALLDHGKPGAFDAYWSVLPCVHKFGDKWHLYYSGRDDSVGTGLQGFWGMGLASSDDLLHWTKHSDEPLIRGDDFPQFPTNKAVGGGGPIIEIKDDTGKKLYRMYYTLSPGTPNKDLLIDQSKRAVVAHSYDGINWFDKKIVLGPRLEAEYENAATIAINPWKTRSGWRGIYAAIGTQFGAYSICEATSEDGIVWERGEPGENLSIPPSGDGWESKMVEYPNVIEEDGKLRLFYCGNSYGKTGIGTALAEKIV